MSPTAEKPILVEPASGEETSELRRARPLLRLLRASAVLVVGGLLALLVWRLVQTGRGPDLVSAIRAGKRPVAPAFHLRVIWPHSETWPAQLRHVASGKVSPSALRGWPVVINFWASWCVPCKKEAPLLAASARAHADRVAFLGIDVQDFTSDARGFLRHYQANYVSVRDGGDSTYSSYGLTGVPETYFVNRQGRIVAHVIGALSPRHASNSKRASSW